MNNHRHAIIIIKNNKEEFLQYYDNVWESYLFLNCKIEDEKDINKIKDEVNNKLKLNIKNIKYCFKKTHTKFSCKDKIDKEYTHYFFEVEVENIDSTKEFIIDNTKYKYFSLEEFYKDERIMEVNSDIVGFIKEYYK